MSKFYPRPHPNSSRPGEAPHDLQGANADKLQLHHHKGLAHDDVGRVVPAAFETLRHALDKHSPADFAAIQLFGDGTPEEGKSRRLVNPQAGLAADHETAACWHFTIPKPPEQAGHKDTAAAEMIEIYWMALLRDLDFSDFEDPAKNAELQLAIAELKTLKLYAKRPADGGNANNPEYVARGALDAKSIFRGGDWWAGSPEHKGPLISQFLYFDVPYGPRSFDQREHRRAKADQRVAVGADAAQAPHMTTFPEWRDVQNGAQKGAPVEPVAHGTYIRNMGDLARYVHIDQLYEAYLNAALILLENKVPLDHGNPYGTKCSPYGWGTPAGASHCTFAKEEGFGTFGGPQILSLVCEVATRALKAIWRQKWYKHLRLRPEAFAGLVHRAVTDDAALAPASAKSALGTDASGAWPIVEASAADANRAIYKIEQEYGSYLLPMVYPEGSPTHPAYGAGHATVAGACVTVLKAVFCDVKLASHTADGAHPLTPVIPDPSTGFTTLKPYAGADKDDLTVHGELDKVAANIANGRNMGGVHWRSDYAQSILLGQRIAIDMLYRQRRDTHERPWSFTFTSFGGKEVEIVFRPDDHREGVYYDGRQVLGPDHDLPGKDRDEEEQKRKTEADQLGKIV